MGTSPEPLTGRDAVEALSLAARLANANARFDRSSLGRALRTRAGRLRIMVWIALKVATPAPSFHVKTRRAGSSNRPARRRQSLARGTPDRPRPPASSRDADWENGS